MKPCPAARRSTRRSVPGWPAPRRDRSVSRPRVAVFGYLSIDRLVTATAIHEAVPGGAALYAALGARLAGAAPRSDSEPAARGCVRISLDRPAGDGNGDP